MLDKLKKYKEYYLAIMFFLGIIWAVFSKYQLILDNNEEMLSTIKTTQQMALKSVIWNDSIPLVERTSACDIYISSGYNSFTKQHCENILLKEKDI